MPVCPGCGSSYEDSFKFCPQCGRAKPEDPKMVLKVEVKTASHDFDCPLCGDASAIKKVSAIVGGDTHIGTAYSTTSGTSSIYTNRNGEHIANAYSSGSTSSHQKSQSVLAKKLTLPEPPIEPEKRWFEAKGCWSWTVGVIAFIGISIILLDIDSYSSLFDSIGGGFLACGIWIFAAGAGTGIVVAVIDLIMNKLNGSEDKYKAAMENYQRELRVYQGTKAQWDKLYYCHKHDVVYTTTLRETVPLDEAIGACFLWSNKNNA